MQEKRLGGQMAHKKKWQVSQNSDLYIQFAVMQQQFYKSIIHLLMK